MTVLNTNLQARNATTQFTSYDFNSAALVNGNILFATDSGLFMQGGDTDNTANISAYFEIIQTDFGIPNLKRLSFMYISYYATEDLLLTLTTEQGTTQTFNLPANISGYQGLRVMVDRDVYGKYWTIKISNASVTRDAAGADFTIHEIKVLPLVITHGRNYL